MLLNQNETLTNLFDVNWQFWWIQSSKCNFCYYGDFLTESSLNCLVAKYATQTDWLIDWLYFHSIFLFFQPKLSLEWYQNNQNQRPEVEPVFVSDWDSSPRLQLQLSWLPVLHSSSITAQDVWSEERTRTRPQLAAFMLHFCPLLVSRENPWNQRDGRGSTESINYSPHCWWFEMNQTKQRECFQPERLMTLSLYGFVF